MKNISYNKEISQMASKFIETLTSSQYTLHFFSAGIQNGKRGCGDNQKN
jgi:hypothetical protein